MEGFTFLVAFGFLCASTVAVSPQMWCVKPDITKMGGGPNVTCKSLAYYVENQLEYFTSDTRVVFLPGNHRLSDMLVIAGVSNLSLSCDWPCGRADVHCDGHVQSGVIFSHSENITIKNINFISCGATTSRDSSSLFGFAALYFGGVAAITMDNVGVVNSRGYGVIATQVCGQNIISFSTFHRNIGGNARFSFKKCSTYTRTSLEIKSTAFLDGKLVNSTAGEDVSGLLIESSCQGTNILLDNVTANGNEGGNVQVKVEADQWMVAVFKSMISGGNGIYGSGLHFLSRFSHDNQHYDNSSANNWSTAGNSLKIVNTVFSLNTARRHGGGLLAELYDTGDVTLQNCTFHDNAVTGPDGHGAALEIFRNPIGQFLSGSLLPSYRVHIVESQFCDNFVSNIGLGSIVELGNIAMASIVDTSFTNNRGTAIAMTSSNVIFKGDVEFNNNKATYGGALRFCALSAMFLDKGTSILFRSNHAYEMGGAIYVQEACSEQLKPCFFQPIVEDGSLVTNLSTQYRINLTFAANTAGIAGSALYGGKIDDCYTYAKFKNRQRHASHYLSAAVFNETFKGYRPGQISSCPIDLNFCGESEYLNEGIAIPVIPGQSFNVSVVAVGQRLGITPAIVTTDLTGDNRQNSTITQSRPVLRTSASKCTNLTVTLLTTLVGNDVEVVLKVQRNCPFSDINGTSTVFAVSVQPCPWGLALNIDTGKCECFHFHSFNYLCDLESLSLTIKHNFGRLDWIGCGNLTDCTNEPVLYARGCGMAEYCNSTQQDITLHNLAQICADNRTGILCGSCAVGQSVVFGTGRCKSCPPSNQYLSLAVLYLAAGMVLVIVLTKLRLTINRGSLNGLLLYANFVHWNRGAFFPQFHNADLLRLIIAWLNLDLGIEVCFFNGMTALHVIWLQIGYIFYVVSLQITIILLCRRYVIFTQFFGRNVTKVLSTLVTLLYAKTLTTVADVLTYTDIHNGSLSNQTFSVLSVDGNVRFRSPQHIPLLIVAVFLAIFLVLFMFSLLFIQLLMQISSWRCFNWVARLQPFFETFTGPCNFSYAFWPGYLFFIRTGFVLSQLHFHQFNSSGAYAYQAGLIGILTIILSFLGPKGVYKKWSLNMLELSLILNLTIASFIANASRKIPMTVTTWSHISIALALLQFFIYHIGNRKKCRWIRSKINLCITYSVTLLTRQSRCERQDPRPVITHTDVTISACEQTSLLPTVHSLSPVVKYEEFREPLMEDIWEHDQR